MKILCETQVINRQTNAVKSARVAKATLAIGFRNTSSAARDADGNRSKELELIHFTPQNKTGTRYKVHKNIEKVFTKFLQDGKATISFVEPPENLLIKCNAIELKAFLQTFKLGLEGKDSINLRTNIAAATAIPHKAQPQLKLAVLKRSDYPTKGFPRTLQTLTVSGINLCKVSLDICTLRYLTSLNLSHNNITELPAALGQLALTEFHANNNALGDANNWRWLKGIQLRNTLRELDLSVNNLCCFPAALCKLEQLVSLKLNQNHLTGLPFAVRRMKKLRYFHLSHNELETLPSSIKHATYEVLDVACNRFKEHAGQPHLIPFHSGRPLGVNFLANLRTVTPLWLQAARVVARHKLPYSSATLPWQLVDILAESPTCACGKLCYAPVGMVQRVEIVHFGNIKDFISDQVKLIFMESVVCGPACFGCKRLMVL